MQGFPFPIITYQVITGNYNSSLHNIYDSWIITYQVITGNYNIWLFYERFNLIITYQVITGNYNQQGANPCKGFNYNIPSNNRELQPLMKLKQYILYYNIPSNNRELQLFITQYLR